jgi:hypothetical protein
VCAVDKRSYYTKFYTENLKEKEQTKDVRVDGRILILTLNCEDEERTQKVIGHVVGSYAQCSETSDVIKAGNFFIS